MRLCAADTETQAGMLITIVDILLRGVAVGLASSITVGPVAVLCIQRTLSKTRRAGLMSGLGVACADTMMAIIAYFFYAMLESQIQQYSHILSVTGGIFVVVVGVVIFFQNPVPQIRRNRAGNNSLWKDFSSMFGFTIANFVVVIPYILAFFAMFGIGTGGTEHTASSLVTSLIIIAGFFCGRLIMPLVALVQKNHSAPATSYSRLVLGAPFLVATAPRVPSRNK